MMNRFQRQQLARETVEIVDRGHYETDGRRIDIRDAVDRCLAATRHFSGDELAAMRDAQLGGESASFDTVIEVVNETTLAGLSRLATIHSGPIGVLNFASAKNPGGGFLSGAQAQEESLARSSALHSSLLTAGAFYERHRRSRSCLYSDDMILSPECPVFRDDDGRLQTEPDFATFITSPAPNAGAAANNRPHELAALPDVLRSRSELILALAASQSCTHLVLGAWGCGVFRNDPATVAQAFASHLQSHWAGRFERVVFSVLDHSPTRQTFDAFQWSLSGTGR